MSDEDEIERRRKVVAGIKRVSVGAGESAQEILRRARGNDDASEAIAGDPGGAHGRDVSADAPGEHDAAPRLVLNAAGELLVSVMLPGTRRPRRWVYARPAPGAVRDAEDGMWSEYEVIRLRPGGFWTTGRAIVSPDPSVVRQIRHRFEPGQHE